MKLYFARHGETDSNANIAADLLGTDEPLNKTGIQQANKLAEQLKDVKFDAILSSPLKRALQTAEAVNTYHHLPIEILDDFQEREHDKNIDINTWNELFDFDKNLSMENVESLHGFFDRVYKALDDLKAKYDDKTIFLASHGGVQHAIYAYANKLPHKGNLRISLLENCEYRVYEL